MITNFDSELHEFLLTVLYFVLLRNVNWMSRRSKNFILLLSWLKSSIKLTNYKNEVDFFLEHCQVLNFGILNIDCLCIWTLVHNEEGRAEMMLLKMTFNIYILIHVNQTTQARQNFGQLNNNWKQLRRLVSQETF